MFIIKQTDNKIPQSNFSLKTRGIKKLDSIFAIVIALLLNCKQNCKQADLQNCKRAEL